MLKCLRYCWVRCWLKCSTAVIYGPNYISMIFAFYFCMYSKTPAVFTLSTVCVSPAVMTLCTVKSSHFLTVSLVYLEPNEAVHHMCLVWRMKTLSLRPQTSNTCTCRNWKASHYVVRWLFDSTWVKLRAETTWQLTLPLGIWGILLHSDKLGLRFL